MVEKSNIKEQSSTSSERFKGFVRRSYSRVHTGVIIGSLSFSGALLGQSNAVQFPNYGTTEVHQGKSIIINNTIPSGALPLNGVLVASTSEHCYAVGISKEKLFIRVEPPYAKPYDPYRFSCGYNNPNRPQIEINADDPANKRVLETAINPGEAAVMRASITIGDNGIVEIAIANGVNKISWTQQESATTTRFNMPARELPPAHGINGFKRPMHASADEFINRVVEIWNVIWNAPNGK